MPSAISHAPPVQPSASTVSPGKRSEAKYREHPASSEVKAATGTFDASHLIRSTIAGLSDKATRGFMTEDTAEHLRTTCPGWDLHALHAEFERWVDADPARLPANWQKAFIGWVKRHHEKHRHELRR